MNVMFDPLFCKILAAFDGSDPSRRALDHAAKMAAMFKGELILLTVVPKLSLPIFPNEGFGHASAIDFQNYQDGIRDQYRKSLEKAEADVRERYPHLKVDAVLLEGRPSEIIIEEAEKRGVNLIMMGSRGLGGITGWILGSTSRRVADQCTKPILIVK